MEEYGNSKRKTSMAPVESDYSGRKKLADELIDPEEQVRVELWEYDPKQFSEDNMSDRLFVALSFVENEDERVDEAVEEVLEGVRF